MFKEKVSFDIATEEVNAWIDRKKIFPKRRELLKDAIETLIEAVVYGTIQINSESGVITHDLLFPILDDSGNIHLDKLEYKARLDGSVIARRIEQMKVMTSDSRLLVYSSCLTDNASGLIQKLQPTDANICQSISVFFM